MSVIMILLLAVSTAQISSLVTKYDLDNNVYAIHSIGERQYLTQADGTDSSPMAWTAAILT